MKVVNSPAPSIRADSRIPRQSFNEGTDDDDVKHADQTRNDVYREGAQHAQFANQQKVRIKPPLKYIVKMKAIDTNLRSTYSGRLMV